MAKQVINIGRTANDRSGDPLRTAFNKVNENFTELYTAITGGVNFSQVNADWNATTGVARILNKPTIPSIAGLATETYVNNAVGAIVIPDVSNFITAEDIPTIPTDVNQLADVDGLLGGSSGGTGNILFNGNNISNSIDNEISVTTEKTITTNNSYTNTTDFSTDVDPGIGSTLAGWYQRNESQIEFSLFGPSAFVSYLTGLALGRTVIVTYSTSGGNQTLTRTLTQQFTSIPQSDPANPTWSRVSGRIDATLPVDQTGIVSINFPVYSTQTNGWEFNSNGDLTLPIGGDILDSNGQSVLSVSRVKSTAVGNRRIEEATGYKEVLVTARTTNNYTGLTSITSNGYELRVARTPELDAVFVPVNQGSVNATFTLSFDNAVYREVWLSSIQETEYWFYYQEDFGQTTPQTEGDTVYLEVITGADPVTWWDKAELPGGAGDFRGAVIDYHAYTGESTIIGTIHIVDDSGEEHISHQEVQSGSTDGENDDLWVVTTEGQIRYRRIDSESKTLKIHWTAKVFYGSELYD